MVRYRLALAFTVLLAIPVLSACGGGSTPQDTPPSPSVVVDKDELFESLVLTRDPGFYDDMKSLGWEIPKTGVQICADLDSGTDPYGVLTNLSTQVGQYNGAMDFIFLASSAYCPWHELSEFSQPTN